MTNSNAHLNFNDLIRLGVALRFHLSSEAGGTMPDTDPQPLDADAENLGPYCLDVASDAINAGTGEENWSGGRVDVTLPDGSLFKTVTFEQLGVA